ncbi:hypothetical protein ACQP1G_38365 [Nocardia sp. CA-107356]|uniref:hypothetical protein n=1 Tax=Nocardia sp. CA-107356 TaxID=3239972 RepID=UPI003D93D970
MPNTRTDIDTDHGEGWLHRGEPVALQTISPATGAANPERGTEWQWISQPPAQSASGRTRAGIPRRVWIGLTGALGVAAALIAVGIGSIADRPDMAAVLPTATASPPTTTSPPGGACTGLSGQTVTDTAGDTHSPPGVIAAFEHAYYRQRSAEATLRLVAPEAGLTLEGLAAGIGSIPIGTTHCVAITPIAEGTAEVHLVEQHPDGQRIDYLQLINVGHGPDGVAITNIQKRG